MIGVGSVRTCLVMAIILSLSPVARGASPTSRIRPLSQTVRFSADCSANSWIGYISNELSEIVYELMLKPEYDVDEHLIGWDLVLHRADRPSVNLLEPKVWHGLLPSFIRAQDFLSGPESSAFGRTRSFKVEKENVVITLTVDDATVQAQSVGAYVFQSLKVSVDAKNLH